MNDQCPGITQAGLKCSAKPPAGKVYCIWHDPDRSAQKAMNAKGGRNSRTEVRAKKKLAAGMQSLSDLRDVLLLAILQCQSGKLEPSILSAMATASRAVKDLTIGADLEERLAELQHKYSDLAAEVTDMKSA